MMENKIICIGREFGSGGHEIAVRTGARLDIRVYEKDLFRLACRYGELSEKIMESADETATNPFLYRTVHEGNYHVTRGLPTSEVLFELQSHEIRHIANRESCIFVGRCAGGECETAAGFCTCPAGKAHCAQDAAGKPHPGKGGPPCAEDG